MFENDALGFGYIHQDHLLGYFTVIIVGESSTVTLGPGSTVTERFPLRVMDEGRDLAATAARLGTFNAVQFVLDAIEKPADSVTVLLKNSDQTGLSSYEGQQGQAFYDTRRGEESHTWT